MIRICDLVRKWKKVTNINVLHLYSWHYSYKIWLECLQIKYIWPNLTWSGFQTTVSCLTEEVKLILAKMPLNFNGDLATLGLTFLVKQTSGIHNEAAGLGCVIFYVHPCILLLTSVSLCNPHEYNLGQKLYVEKSWFLVKLRLFLCAHPNSITEGQ